MILVTDQVPPFLEWQLPLHLSYSTEWHSPYICPPQQNGSALISDLLVRMAINLISVMEGTNPLTMTECLSPYI